MRMVGFAIWKPFRNLACLAAGTLVLATLAFSQDKQFDWRFTLKADQVASSNITATNECRKRHRFEIDPNGLPAFMHLMGDSTFDVESRAQHTVPVKFDAHGLKAGDYQALVVIKCKNCKEELSCRQDRSVLHVYMTVRSQSDENFVPDRVLVLIPSDSGVDINTWAKHLAASNGMTVVEVDPLVSLRAALVVYSLPPGSDVLAKVAELFPQVLLAQPDFLYRTLAAEQPLTQLQYGRRLIRADQVGPSITGKGVRLAIVDTGIDSAHPALKGKIAGQLDATGLGFTADIHGTLLAGIVVGEELSGAGIAGVAPGAEILAIKACQPVSAQDIAAQCWSRTLGKALDYVIQNKAKVVNLSLGGPADKLVERLIDAAVDRGIAVVAAAGNDGPQGRPGFPAALPKVVAVTAVDANEQLYPSATQGNFVQVAAPGVEIVSTSPGGKVMVSSGTSLAAAFVSGTAALLLQQEPQLSPSALQSLLESTAKDLGPAGKDPQFGSGLIDACRAATQLGENGISCH